MNDAERELLRKSQLVSVGSDDIRKTLMQLLVTPIAQPPLAPPPLAPPALAPPALAPPALAPPPLAPPPLAPPPLAPPPRRATQPDMSRVDEPPLHHARDIGEMSELLLGLSNSFRNIESFLGLDHNPVDAPMQLGSAKSHKTSAKVRKKSTRVPQPIAPGVPRAPSETTSRSAWSRERSIRGQRER